MLINKNIRYISIIIKMYKYIYIYQYIYIYIYIYINQSIEYILIKLESVLNSYKASNAEKLINLSEGDSSIILYKVVAINDIY